MGLSIGYLKWRADFNEYRLQCPAYSEEGYLLLGCSGDPVITKYLIIWILVGFIVGILLSKIYQFINNRLTK